MDQRTIVVLFGMQSAPFHQEEALRDTLPQRFSQGYRFLRANSCGIPSSTVSSTKGLSLVVLPPLSLQTFDPKNRATVEEALAHPYVEAYVCLPPSIANTYLSIF
jgi:hypothetical protein